MKSKQIGKEKLNSELAKLYLKTLEKPKKFELGQRVFVIIKDIKDPEFIFVESDIGIGIIPKNQFLDKDNQLIVNVGETISAFFIGEKEGDLFFTILPIGNYSKVILENAKINRIPLKGKIDSIMENGFHVRMGDELTFCPKSKLQKEVKKGDILDFMVIDKSKNFYIVSHSDYIQIQKEQFKNELIQKLKTGIIITGKIKNFIKNGAFLDLGYEIEAFIPLREISHKRIEHPSEILQIGTEIRAKILELNWKEDKIIASIKELEKNPWLGPLPFQKGDILEVKILQVLQNGLLVSLPEKFHGFIPLKEMNLKKQKEALKQYQKDQTLKAMIIQIDKENQKITLSIKEVEKYYEQIEYKKYMEQSEHEDSMQLGSIIFKE